jgi:hypothetical protein
MSSRFLVVALAIVLVACTGERDSRESAPTGGTAGASRPEVPPAESPPRGVLVDCSWHSEATFPGAYSDPGNIVVGPLALVWAATAARQSPALIRKLGGWKSALLVKADHTVTLRIPEAARSFAGLGYGPLPQGFIDIRDAHHTITFVPCPQDEPAYGGVQPTVGPVTFWSGAVVVNRAPACVPLEVFVDDEPTPRRLVVSLAAGRCEGQLAQG